MKVGILISDGMESPDNLSKHKIPASLRTDLISIDTDLLFFNLNRTLTINFIRWQMFINIGTLHQRKSCVPAEICKNVK